MKLSKDITMFNDELSIPFLEDEPNAKFLLETNLQSGGVPILVFYNEKPHPRGSNYAGFFVKTNFRGESVAYIMDAIAVEDIEFVGLEEDGVVYHSRYQHDYRSTPKGAAIDGGQLGCTRVRGYADGSFPKSVSFRIKAGEVIFA